MNENVELFHTRNLSSAALGSISLSLLEISEDDEEGDVHLQPKFLFIFLQIYVCIYVCDKL